MRIYLSILSLFCCSIFAQQKVATIPVPAFNISNKQSYLITNESKDTNAIFFVEEDSNIVCLWLDQKYKVIQFRSFQLSGLKDIQIIGGFYGNSKYDVIISDVSGHEYVQLSYIYDRETEFVKYSIKEDETFLNRIVFNNKVIFLTIKSKTSILSIYEICKQQKIISHYINLGDIIIKDKSYVLSDILMPNRFSILPVFNNDIVENLDKSAFKNKAYIFNNCLYITSDIFLEFTYVAEINLENFNFNIYKVERDYLHPPFAYEDDLDANSYFFKGKLLEIICGHDTIIYFFKDLKNNTISDYTTLTSSEIHGFRSSSFTSVIQKKKKINIKSLSPDWSMDKFIKKINVMDPCIFAYTTNDSIDILIGGSFVQAYKKIPVIIPIPGAAILNVIPVYIKVNNGLFPYFSEQVFFKTSYDQSWNHLGNNISNPIQEIFLNFIYLRAKSINNVFQSNLENKTILGYYDYERRCFELYTF